MRTLITLISLTLALGTAGCGNDSKKSSGGGGSGGGTGEGEGRGGTGGTECPARGGPAECPNEGEGVGDASAKVGGECAADGDCGAGGTCLDALPGGYCSVDAAGDGTCGAGQTPFDFDDAGKMCLKSCDTDEDCRDHYCHYCDEDKTCWAWTLPDEVPVGDACAGDADCGETGVCLTDWAGFTFPGGTCAIDALEYCCPEGTEEFGFEDDEGLYCLKTCQSGADCRAPEYECSAGNACFPVDGGGN